MYSYKRGYKLLAILLILVMCLTNPLFIGPVYAASAGDKDESRVDGFTLNAKKDLKQNTEAAAAANPDDRHLSDGEKINQFVNKLVPYFLKNGKKNGPEWLKTTDFEVSFSEHYKPGYTFTTIQPFGKVNDHGELWFWQGRYTNQSDDNTANLGLGWRKLSADKQQMVGFNLFYDYGFKHDLTRIGAGTEYFNRLSEYRANVYIPTSGDKLTGVSYQTNGILYSYIRAVPGVDFEAGTSFAHARWLNLYASGYFYDNDYHDNEIGYRLRGVFKLSPQFTLEAGYDKSNLSSGGFYGKFAYKLASGFGPSLKDKKADKLDLSSKFLQKVERNNTIKTETFNKFVSYQGSIKVTVLNNSNHALYGAKVQAYQNGSPVGAAVVTNAEGVAVLSGLNYGNYSVRATYFNSYNDATVTLDTPIKAASIPLPISASGGAQAKVLNAAGQLVSGANVSLEMVSSAAAPQMSWLARLFGIQRAYAAEGAFTLTTTSGADGTAVFKDLPLGTYKFTVSYNGQMISSSPLAVQDGKTALTDVVLLSPGSSGTGSAVITVQDANGTALAGAEVSLPVGGNTQIVSTNAKGLGIFSDIPQGTYTCTIKKPGYDLKQIPLAINSGVTAVQTVKLSSSITYAITATVTGGTGGTITPAGGSAITATGTVNVANNSSPAFVITAKSGYAIQSITVDGSPVAVTGSPQTYTFSNVTAAHAITVAFVQTYAITATVTGGKGGTITPQGGSAITTTGITNVKYDGSLLYTITADTGYHIASITVNGSPLTVTGSPQTYNFSHVTSAQSITVAFMKQTGSAQVTVKSGGTAVTGATVKVDGTSLIATTDGSGIATISNIPVGSYTFTASKTGYTSATSASTQINNGQTASVDISVTQQFGSAQITVKSGGTAVPGATVKIDGTSLIATTGGSGIATISNIPVGSYTFTASKTGYDPATSVSTQINNNQTATVDISVTQQTGSAQVTVKSGGIAVAGATVKVDGTSLIATTDGSGIATISNIPVGSYTFTASKTGYTSATSASTQINNGQTATVDITVTQQFGSAQVTVKSGGTAVPGATVKVDGTSLIATTDGSGVAKISNIPIGSYTFTVSKTGYASATSASTQINNGQTANVDISVTQQFGSAQVTVKSGGTAVPGATVKVDGTSLIATTDGSGIATISNIPVGSYTFTASKTDYTSAVSANTQINDGQTATVDISIAQQTGSAQVIVKSGGTAVPGATVKVDGTSLIATTDGSGVATISNIPIGSYTFTASKIGYDPATSASTLISNAQTSNVDISMTQLTGSAAVTVKCDGTALQGATVTVDTGLSATTNASGMAIINSIPVGNHTFTVTKAGYTTIISPSTAINKDVSTSLELALTAQTGSAEITVTDASGAAVNGAKVTLSGTSTIGTQYNVTPPIDDSSNVVKFSNVPVGGNYTYTVEKSGYVTSSGSIAVDAATTAKKTVQLTELGKIQVTVNSSDSAASPTFKLGSDNVSATKVGNVYTISGLTAGTYNLEVSSPDYKTESMSVSVSNGATTTKSVTLQAIGTITINVSCGGKEPKFKDNGADVSPSTSGTSHTFTFNAGTTHKFTISADGYTPQDTASFTINKGANTALDVSLVLAPTKVTATINIGMYTTTKYIYIYKNSDMTLVTHAQVVNGSATFTLEPMTDDCYYVFGMNTEDESDVSGGQILIQTNNENHVDAGTYPLTLL